MKENIKDVITIKWDGEGYVCKFTRTRSEDKQLPHRIAGKSNLYADYLDEVLRFVRIHFSEDEKLMGVIVNKLLNKEDVYYAKEF